MELTDPDPAAQTLSLRDLLRQGQAARPRTTWPRSRRRARAGRSCSRSCSASGTCSTPSPKTRSGGPSSTPASSVRAQPDWENLTAQWRELSGLEPASANPDFSAFVRMALGLPVLEEPLLEAVRSFMKLYASFLTNRGRGRRRASSRRSTRSTASTSRTCGRSRTGSCSALSADKFQLTPWHHEGRLTDWMKEGLGIERLPTTAMTLMPVDPPDEALDPMRTLVRNAQIQRARDRLRAARCPRPPATRLQDYGVSLVTSTEPGRNAARARLELRERAQRFQNFVQGALPRPLDRRHRPHAGAGRAAAPVAPRGDPGAAHVRAAGEGRAVLRRARRRARPCATPICSAPPTALLEAFERESDVAIRLASDKYVQLVLQLLGRPHRGDAQPVPGDAVPVAHRASSAATRSAPRRATASPTTWWASSRRRSRCTR